MTVLVTGATGLIGNNVVRALLERGRAVRCLVRAGSDPRPLEGLDVELSRGDLRDAAAVARAVEGAELVVHAGARVGVGRRDLAASREVNVGGTAAVASACRSTGARMVHVSSVDALAPGTRSRPADEDSPPRPFLAVPYMITKREAEDVVLGQVAQGLDAVVVSPGFVLGPWDWKPSSGRLLLAVARGRGRVAPPGGNDFCHVGDVVAGLLAAAERGPSGRRWILSGEALTYRRAFELFADVTGGAAPRWTAPAAVVRMAGRLGDATGLVTGREPELNSASARAACLPHHYDSGRARRELGYAPRPAADAARGAWQWFRSHGYV